MTQKLTFLDKLTLYFHKDIDTLRENFAEREINRILRMRDLYKEILRNPMEPDHQRKRWLMEKYHIQERQALYDIADLRAVVGPSLKFDKEFERYEMAQGLRDMMVIAKEKNDVKSYASLAKEYNSIMRLSKDDPEKVKKDINSGKFCNIAFEKNFVIIIVYKSERNKTAFKLVYSSMFDEHLKKKLDLEFKQ